MRSSSLLIGLGLLVLLAFAVPLPAAQDAAAPVTGFAAQSLRPYQFVFLAYAIAWLLVLGWVIAVARRLARLEKRLGR
jgi:CcmD family protein